ncbi:hypothetical protein IKX12_01990 [Candidatus Saccharibacteria bacterium]|nr:hypothetical protein [Candidatus Saccharibacteria bacterium]
MSNNTNNEAIVYVAYGAGNEPIEVEYHENDTVASVLERAGVIVDKGMTPTLGKKRVRKPEKTTVSAGDLIVIAGKPSNGQI